MGEPALKVYAPQVDVGPIQFYDDQVRSWKDPDTRIYVVIRDPCLAMGLDVPAKQRRIQKDQLINGFMKVMPIATLGGPQEVIGIDLQMITMWRAYIDPARQVNRVQLDSLFEGHVWSCVIAASMKNQ
jgi:hypothetical protein